MSLENIELIYQAADAFNLGALSAFLSFCHPKVRFVSRLVPLDGDEPRRGHDGVRSWWGTLHDAFEELDADIDDVRDIGEVTLARVRLSGRRVRNDSEMEQTQWHVVTWRQGTAVSWRIFLTEDDALNAAGLRE